MATPRLRAGAKAPGARVSPEGTRGALIVDAARDREDDRFAALWIVPADGQAAPHRLTHGADGEKSAQWSPDSRVAFVAARPRAAEWPSERSAGEGAGGLRPQPPVWVFDLERGGEPRPLADRAEGVESCAWSPDGKVLAVAARDPSAQQAAYLASIRQPRHPGP